jgi:hypothetical protein
MSRPWRGDPRWDSHAPGLGTALLITAVVRALTVALLLTVFWPTPVVSHLVQDIRTWREFFAETQAGAIPYVSLTKEYPVLGGILYWLMSPFVRPDDLRQTIVVHAAFMGVADLINAALLYKLARQIAPRWAFAATLVLSLNLTAIVTAPVRYESWITTFVLLGYMAHRRRRFRWAAFFWSIGCGLKWYPAFFIAAQEWRLLAVERRRWHWLGAGAVFLAVTAALNVPFAVLCLRETGSLANWLAPYVFHVKRPLYWDTLLGVGQIWLGPLPWERYAGLWSLVLMLAAVVVRPRLPIEYKGVLVCLAGVFFNRIYSTQFNLWFYPFLILGVLADDDERRRRHIAITFLVLDVLNVVIYPLSFAGAVAEMGGFFPGAAREGGRWTIVFSAAIALRTALVAVLAVLLMAGRSRGGQRGAGASESKVAPETESG